MYVYILSLSDCVQDIVFEMKLSINDSHIIYSSLERVHRITSISRVSSNHVRKLLFPVFET